MKKTNAMRQLDQHKLVYTVHEYDPKHGIDGITVAEQLNRSHISVYKTLVVKGNTDFYVCVIPVDAHLSLKKVAKNVGEKKIEMIKHKDLLKVTGYIKGGCSPIGMKKQFKTLIDESVLDLETMVFSAGKIGCQIELNPSYLIELINAEVKSIIEI